jgi:glycosyltransferase involved in cell wall biosynthesis
MNPQSLDKTQADLNSNMLVSVVVCTYNPSGDHLTRTLEALSSQSLHLAKWELILVDNNSDSLLSLEYPVEWHPNARWIHESIPGKPNAIMRGIQCAQANLIITVDDDNLLDSDYLSTALKIQAENPDLGVFGSGSTEPAFKGKLPSWFSPEIAAYLALRRVNQVYIHQTLEGGENARPWGLGLCVTRRVALAWLSTYLDIISDYPYLNGRKGAILDDDLFSLCAVHHRLSYGIFPELRLKHIIEPLRLKVSYLSDLAHDHGYSHAHYSKISGSSQSNPTRIGSAKAAFMLLLKGKLKAAMEESRYFIYHLSQSKQLRTLRVSQAKGWDQGLSTINNSDQRL